MATLPLFHDEPISSIRATMLFPNDMIKAANCAAWMLVRGSDGRGADVRAIGVERVHRLALGAAAHSPFEADQNAAAGGAVGVIVCTLLGLMNEEDYPRSASWNRAIEVASANASQARGKSQTAVSAATLRSKLAEFAPVMHLWGAWGARAGRWRADPSVGYSHSDDCQMLIAESEAIVEALRKWDSQRDPPSKYLKADLFQVARDWRPPHRQANWPLTGVVPKFTLDYAKMPFLASARKAGRPPRKPL